MKFDPLYQHGSHPAANEVPTTFGLVTAAAVAELTEAIPPAQLRGFYLAVGRRIAATETLDGVDDAADLGFRVNAFWATIGWGEAELAIERDAIVVRHRDIPHSPPLGVTPEAWSGMLLGVLEGAYDAWFRRLGSGPNLHTRAEWNGDMIELRHGR